MIVSLIAAVAENGVIGKDNKLPWHLPADMKYFRDTTMGHCVIMGRRNYDSIPPKFRPFGGRTNIVVTRSPDLSAPGCIVVHSINDALKEAQKKNEKEVFIIGGADIYNQTIEKADKLYITHIDQAFEGDAFFPKIDPRKWKLTGKKDMLQDARNKHSFSFCVYDKVI